MPREKHKVWMYTSEGVYIKEFESIAEVQEVYYNSAKYPLFRNYLDENIHELPDGNILCKIKYGRENIRKYFVRKNDPFISAKKYDQKKGKVILKNRDGEVIATFKNTRIAEELLKINQVTLWNKLNRNKGVKALDNLFAEFEKEDIL